MKTKNIREKLKRNDKVLMDKRSLKNPKRKIRKKMQNKTENNIRNGLTNLKTRKLPHLTEFQTAAFFKSKLNSMVKLKYQWQT